MNIKKIADGLEVPIENLFKNLYEGKNNEHIL